jgi:hypothetical protein
MIKIKSSYQYIIIKWWIFNLKELILVVNLKMKDLGTKASAITLISDSETFELSDMFIEAGANMLSGMTTFAGSVIGGLIGINVPGKFSFKNFALNQVFMGLSGFYLVKYTLSLLKKKLQEIY